MVAVVAPGARFVLVEGLHRLEAAKALGEKVSITIEVEATAAAVAQAAEAVS